MSDADKLELLVQSGKDLVAVGEAVMADGKVDWKDAQHAPKLFEAGIDFVKAIKAYKEIKEEVADLDASELAKLGAMILGK